MTTKTKIDLILGRAAKYPFKIENGTWPLTQPGKVGQQKHIKDSLLDLIFTTLGERLHRRGYGSLALEYIFENIDEVYARELETNIYDIIANYEGKIDVQLITVTPDPDNARYIVNIEYTFANEVKPNNIIFPISAKDFKESEYL